MENPALLGLGDLVVKDQERHQPRAGRLDLLLADLDSETRYEVELQLGSTDESHIIRTIEYWDLERRRYPQYDRCAVIVAETITARFLNVIALFNGYIPIIAIQLRAFGVDDGITLIATTVLDRMTLGTDEEDAAPEPTDRAPPQRKSQLRTQRSQSRLVVRNGHIVTLPGPGRGAVPASTGALTNRPSSSRCRR